jgi:FkbM family methyltransferase
MTIKGAVKRFLQRLLGFHAYLVTHAIFVTLTLPFRREEGAVLRFIAALRRDAVVLDVGANVGAMTLLFARRCKDGHVYAFEPIPENYRAASRLLQLFRVRNARLFATGLSDKTGEAEMIMPHDGAVRLEGLSRVVDPALSSHEQGTRYTVPLARLDDIPELAGVKVDAIKIDVESHEQYVLRGARGIIARDHPLIYCELWEKENKEASLAFLKELGYKPYVAGPRKLEPYHEGSRDAQNLFFLTEAHGALLTG